MTLAAPGRFRPTRRIDVKLQLLPSTRKLKNRALVHFHTGSFETMAELIALDSADFSAGSESFAQLKLKSSVLVLPGDRFIIRQSSPLITIGGGTILDPIPRRLRSKEPSRLPLLSAIENGHHPEVLAQLVERSIFGVPQKDLPARTGWTDTEIRQAINGLTSTGCLRAIPADSPLLFRTAAFQDLLKKIADRIERFHK
jgi:selenocysteine-specific elongation factor